MKIAVSFVALCGMMAILFIGSVAWLQLQADNAEMRACEAAKGLPMRTRHGVLCLKRTSAI